MMKNRIRQNFSQAVHTYNEFGKTQHQIASDFSQKLSILQPPKSVLEIGCGTGFLSAFLQAYDCPLILSDLSCEMVFNLKMKDPSLLVFDAEYFPFKTSFDWIVSSLSFQWFDRPDQTLHNLREHCNTLAFTTLGDNNFFEWAEFCEQHNIENRLRPMLSEQDLRTILGENIDIQETYYSESHPNWLSFWNSIYKIGAHTSLRGQKKFIPRILFETGPITCSYHVLTVIAKSTYS